MSELFKGLCPMCAATANWDKGATEATCESCGFTGSLSDFGAEVAESAMPVITGFDNPESGVVFIENFFDTYNWDVYQKTTEIEIKAIAEVIRNNKMKNGAVAQSWYLDFMGLAVPVAKKFEGLTKLAEEIGEKYDPQDSTEAYRTFDLYARISKLLLLKKDAIVKQLEVAIQYATKFKLDADKLAAMNAKFDEVKKMLEGLSEVKEIAEVPAFVAAREKASEAIAEEFKKRNIDAKSVYEAAVAAYNNPNPDKSPALIKFESIRGYMDSVEYINKINKYFDFNEEMYNFYGKYYIYKEEAFSLGTLDVGALGDKLKGKKGKEAAAAATTEAPAEEQQTAKSLYEVVKVGNDWVPDAKPLIKGIDFIIANYGNKLFYFKKNQGIFSFDLFSKSETQIDKAKDENYVKCGKQFEHQVVCAGTAILVKKKLEAVIKKGCMGFVKNKAEDVMLNNFCLLLIDMKTNSGKVVVNELVDVVGRYGDKVFYNYATKDVKKVSLIDGCMGKKPEVAPVMHFMMCDLATGENKQVLSEACELQEVLGDNIVYTLWTPNEYNKDLHVYNMKTGKDVLIEDNIYNYFCEEKGMIYYTVGNAEYRPLMRNNLEGTDRKEIMTQVEKVVDKYAGWLYLIKGAGKYKALVKVNPDTAERVYLCPQYKTLVTLDASHISYLDTSDALHIVRTDGKDNRVVAKGIRWTVVAEDCIYYIRDEFKTMSLYRMDKSGHNVKKLVYGVDMVKNYDETCLYYKKEEDVRFEVIKPSAVAAVAKKGKKKEEGPIYETHHVKRYFKFDKATEKSEAVLTLGLPSGTEAVQVGCSKKTKDEAIIYNPVPVVRQYKPKGLMPAGAVEKEKTKEANQEATDNLNAKIEGVKDFLDKIKTKLGFGKNVNPNKASTGASVKSGRAVKGSVGTLSVDAKRNTIVYLTGVLIATVFLVTWNQNTPSMMPLVAAIACFFISLCFGLYFFGLLPKKPDPRKYNNRLCGMVLILTTVVLLFGAIFPGIGRGCGQNQPYEPNAGCATQGAGCDAGCDGGNGCDDFGSGCQDFGSGCDDGCSNESGSSKTPTLSMDKWKNVNLSEENVSTTYKITAPKDTVYTISLRVDSYAYSSDVQFTILNWADDGFVDTFRLNREESNSEYALDLNSGDYYLVIHGSYVNCYVLFRYEPYENAEVLGEGERVEINQSGYKDTLYKFVASISATYNVVLEVQDYAYDVYFSVENSSRQPVGGRTVDSYRVELFCDLVEGETYYIGVYTNTYFDGSDRVSSVRGALSYSSPAGTSREYAIPLNTLDVEVDYQDKDYVWYKFNAQQNVAYAIMNGNVPVEVSVFDGNVGSAPLNTATINANENKLVYASMGTGTYYLQIIPEGNSASKFSFVTLKLSAGGNLQGNLNEKYSKMYFAYDCTYTANYSISNQGESDLRVQWYGFGDSEDTFTREDFTYVAQNKTENLPLQSGKLYIFEICNPSNEFVECNVNLTFEAPANGESVVSAYKANMGGNSVNVDEYNEYVYYTFTPSTSRSYSIVVSGVSYMEYAYVWFYTDAMDAQLGNGDYVWSGNGNNYSTNVYLQAGTTYYIRAGFEYSGYTGSFTFTIN